MLGAAGWQSVTRGSLSRLQDREELSRKVNDPSKSPRFHWTPNALFPATANLVPTTPSSRFLYGLPYNTLPWLGHRAVILCILALDQASSPAARRSRPGHLEHSAPATHAESGWLWWSGSDTTGPEAAGQAQPIWGILPQPPIDDSSPIDSGSRSPCRRRAYPLPRSASTDQARPFPPVPRRSRKAG